MNNAKSKKWPKLQTRAFLCVIILTRSDLEAGDTIGEDVLSVMPFNNTVDKLIMSGQQLRRVLETFAAQLCPDASCYPKTFVQVNEKHMFSYHIKCSVFLSDYPAKVGSTQILLPNLLFNWNLSIWFEEMIGRSYNFFWSMCYWNA